MHSGRWGVNGSIFPWIGIVLAIVLAVLAVALLPPLFSPALDDPRAQFEVLDRARLTVAAIIGSVGILLGVYINWRRVNALERQVTTLQLGQITERFTRAIDQLGSVRADNELAPEIRAGGVRSLERIARESANDFWPILDILTAYLRAECRWEPPLPNQDYPKGYKALPEEILNRMDVAFTVDAIVRLCPHRKEAGSAPLNLEHTFVPGLDLREKYLVGANLRGAGLYLAILEGADLQGAKLEGAFLRRAYLSGANLQDADFRGATLEGRVLRVPTSVALASLVQTYGGRDLKVPISVARTLQLRCWKTRTLTESSTTGVHAGRWVSIPQVQLGSYIFRAEPKLHGTSGMTGCRKW